MPLKVEGATQPCSGVMSHQETQVQNEAQKSKAEYFNLW